MAAANKSDTVPRWLIGVVITLAIALSGVGGIAVANRATYAEHSRAQDATIEDIRGDIAASLQDVKDRLVRIENKLDGLGVGYENDSKILDWADAAFFGVCGDGRQH